METFKDYKNNECEECKKCKKNISCFDIRYGEQKNKCRDFELKKEVKNE